MKEIVYDLPGCQLVLSLVHKHYMNQNKQADGYSQPHPGPEGYT